MLHYSKKVPPTRALKIISKKFKIYLELLGSLLSSEISVDFISHVSSQKLIFFFTIINLAESKPWPIYGGTCKNILSVFCSLCRAHACQNYFYYYCLIYTSLLKSMVKQTFLYGSKE